MARSRNNQTNDFSKKLANGFASIVKATTSVFDEPFTLTLLVLSFCLVFINTDETEHVLFKSITNALRSIPAFVRLATWMDDHEGSIIGFSILMPGAFSVPKRYHSIAVAACAAVVLFADSLHIMTYAAISLVMRLYFKTNGLGRIIVVGIMIAILVLNHDLPGTGSTISIPGNGTLRNLRRSRMYPSTVRIPPP